MPPQRSAEILGYPPTGPQKPVTARPHLGLDLAFNPTLLVASALLNLVAVALPVFTLQVYDRVVPNASTDTLLLLVAILGLVLVFETAMRMARSVLAGWAGARFEHRLGCTGIERLLGADLRAAEKDTAGSHLERLAAIDRLRDFYANQGATILIDLPFALLFAVIVWAIGGDLVWVSAAVFAAFAIVAAIAGRLLHRAVEDRTDSDNRRTSFMIEVLSGITTVKAMTMERQMMRRYERLMDGASAAAYRVTLLSAASQGLGTLFSNLAIVLVISFGALLVLDQQITIGQLACCSLLTGRIMQPLLRAMGIWTNFQSIRVAEQQLGVLRGMPQEPVTDDGRDPLVRAGQIDFQAVSFGYGDGRMLLDKADLHIAAGETVAIVAENGSGRSTVLSLIAGLMRPTAGRIFYDGLPLGAGDPRPGPSEIGILPRRGTVFQGSLIDNLTMFRRGPVVDVALGLAEKLELDRYVASLANGYETEISGGQTETLPGGVRQRIAIIRSLVDQPRIILFDESNNGLDKSSNEKMLQMLQDMKGERTIVLLSYQPSLLRLADRVLELRDGRFIERPAGAPLPASVVAGASK